MKALQGIGAPRFPAPGMGPQQGSPVFAGQYPAPYAPITVAQNDDTTMTDMLNAIMPLIMMMMMMAMIMPMMKGMVSQVSY